MWSSLIICFKPRNFADRGWSLSTIRTCHSLVYRIMILHGLSWDFCSAISISQDSELRKSIRNFAMKESRLLDSIGGAHMEQEIQKRV